MEFESMSIEELEARCAQIREEIEAPDADLDALENEARAIREEIDTRKATEEKKAEIRSKVAAGDGQTTQTFQKEEKREMTLEEIRSSKEYINAFANYIKTGKDDECRALLTNMVSGGQVPVPTIVEGRIRTAWERNGLMDLVRKTYVPGILKVGFERSATGAVVHTEGADAPDEEVLTFGIVTMTPASIKKWIRISDEALDMGGEEFLNYIYDELSYQIAKEAARQLITAIDEAPAASSATAAGVPAITGAPSDLAVVAKAVARLSDDAANPVVVMNKQTHADIIAAVAAASYMFDPLDGYEVHYNNSLKAFSAASTGDTWMIVGDFGYGAQANFPNGDEIRIKYDDLTDAESDLVKLVGREYVAIGITAPNAFTKVTKA